MGAGAERILTTHVGSPVRPPELRAFLAAIRDDQPYEEAAFERCLRESVDLIGGTDCGFAQGPFVQRVHPSIVWAKLGALAEGAALASAAPWPARAVAAGAAIAS
jgi:methionine synthase II (cobalamin-independent)